ncbi:homoserine dehydrogenase [Tautonia plasticadhaerens]|uniref:Homoserine dehydrogenase n=1 Tax=Tautonia plasticadhaerens TaxID=2527974 RepID=A0A518GXE8_9BACT|nr:homoserine dehydrogenase [Tautonia plasticadhaerens]QDV33268.1 Homoserine dehydrogenase [Tautonia plasticadhaerens]
MQPVAIGLLGLGTVGAEVARLVMDREGAFARRVGRWVVLRKVAVRDPHKGRSLDLPIDRLSTDPVEVAGAPEVDVVVELMGGIEPARTAVLAALRAGKDVVTANKALLAEHGAEIFDAARRSGRAVAFEGAVGGGIPIIQSLGVGLAGNRFRFLAAILNGTCNFILSNMTRSGLSYDEALRQAQSLGYAEADPALDVDGTDTAHKLAILVQLAFGASVTTALIPRQGIDTLQSADIQYAAELGYTVKLLAVARDHGEAGLELRVAPRLVRRGSPLAEVTGPDNAIRTVGEPVGATLISGQGAGAGPTASAVIGDLIDVIVGRAALTARSLDLWPGGAPEPRLCSPRDVRRRSYLRFSIADRPGVLGSIAQVLGRHGVSIASVIQHDPGEDDQPDAPVPLVMMTHLASEADLDAAMEAIDRLLVVSPPSVRLGVED